MFKAEKKSALKVTYNFEIGTQSLKIIFILLSFYMGIIGKHMAEKGNPLNMLAKNLA